MRYSAPGGEQDPRAADHHEGTWMRLGFGCVNLGSAGAQQSVRADVRLVQEAIDHGVGVFDTADAYGNGASERILGRALRGRRDDVVVATKGGYVFRERLPVEQRGRRLAARAIHATRRSRAGGGPAGSGGGAAYQQRDDSPRHLRTAIEASLRRLRTDRIDVYQLHGPQDVLPIAVRRAPRPRGRRQDRLLRRRRRERRIRRRPGSTCRPCAPSRCRSACSTRRPPRSCSPAGPSGRSTSGSAGCWGAACSPRRRATSTPSPMIRRRPTIARLADLARRSGLALDALAVGYVRSFPGVSTMLVGISSRAHLDRNVSLMAAPALPDDVRAELDDITATVGDVHG